MSSSIRTSTVALASAGAVVTGFLDADKIDPRQIAAYAVYFDHKRQTDPDFRKALKRESRKEARAAKEEAEVQGAQQREAIKAAVAEAQDEGFPTNLEEKEAYFMSEVGQGEALCQDGSDQVEAALCFYKALKVYPQQGDLISIYDKTVPKPVLDILAEMVAADTSIQVGPFGGSAGSDSGAPVGVDD